jgi:type IV pilus assembly protein PilB
LLLNEGLITQADLDAALAMQDSNGKPLGRILIEQGRISERDLVRTLANQVGLGFVDLDDILIDTAVTMLVPESLVRRYQAIPIHYDEQGRLVVTMADPSNVFAADDIRAMTGAEVVTVVSPPSQVQALIERVHRLDGEVDSMAQEAATEFGELDDTTRIDELIEDAPIVKFVNLTISQAVSDRASDIHVEPTEHDLRIRYRVDGVLHEVMHAPKQIQAGVISRLKVMAEINIAERRVPQDGRVSVTVGGKAVDLRVATLPTVFGEKIVMRILDKSTALLRLSDLGFLPDNLARFEQSYRKPYGTILVTGPTGSGKSTTLYATLNIVNDEAKNIITVEDPVEYRIPGINQVQVNNKAGLTFAGALRSILRSDPDIVLVGEIRDKETATIAIEAALTGHLVLSTLHTNDAATTPTRLVEMGVEPFLVASALDCIVAQRLARRLCDRCKIGYRPEMGELELAGWDVSDLAETPEVFKPVGCGVCSGTGYYGRFAIHEVMNVTEDIERMIVDRGHSEDMKKMAVAQGMLTLRQGGLQQVIAGKTSIEEILRVVA